MATHLQTRHTATALMIACLRFSLPAMASLWISGTLGMNGSLTQSADAQITIEQRRESRRLQEELSAVERLVRDEEFGEAAEKVREVQASLEAMTADENEDVARLLRTHFRRLQTVHGRLVLEGFGLDPIRMPGAEPDEPEPGSISFVEHVAPILVGKCGRCHVGRTSGGVSLANYDSIITGPTEGRIILGGNAEGSRMIEVIVEGDMPRGGGQVSEEELATLMTWIDEGARYDGEDVSANLSTLLPEDSPDARPSAELVMATGNESISFAADIAPILIDNCRGCHIDAQNARGGLRMDAFNQLLRGGDNGSMIVQGKPDESLLIAKLEGTADGQRMPAGRPALEEDQIAMVSKWIEEGATFDGRDPQLAIATVASIALAANATHEQLSAQRLDLANENWQLALPGIDAQQSEFDDFVVIGNVAQSVLDNVGERAEEVTPVVARLFRADRRDPLIKGRMSLFVFRGRYDYSEFGQMVERRQIPDGWKGHWRYTVVDAYGAMLLPRDEEEFSLDALLAQQMAGTYIAAQSPEIPMWFSEGAGRVAALRVEREDPRVVSWQQAMPEVLSGMRKTDDFLTGALSPEDSYIASFGFVEFLMSDSRRFPRFLNALRDGESFDDAFQANYGGTPAEVAAVWVPRTLSGRR